MLAALLRNHVLANLSFALVLVTGFLSYQLMPREQDPEINFNWIEVSTFLPGASASDMERRVTDVLEDAIRKLPDIKFVSSTSREGVSRILIRFEDIDARKFDKRVTDLRREIQAKEDELPEQATDPDIIEVTTANAFPTATLVVTGPADDENLRRQARAVRDDLERIKGVDRVVDYGLRDPELQVNFIPERLDQLGLAPTDLADTIQQNFRDISAGSTQVGETTWLVRLSGTNRDPDYLATLPVLTARGEVPLGSLASIERGRAKANLLVSYQGQAAILLGVTKQAGTNTLTLVDRIIDYVTQHQTIAAQAGVEVVLIDDQTQITRDALSVMQTNAGLGFLLVLLVTYLFLGTRISLLTCIGMPFILAGTFALLYSFEQTLNVSVLLGVVISLGMLVDDAVVVVEAIYYRLQQGYDAMPAALGALREVFAPVTTAVLTTMAAFLPLMLLPGILGKFMLIIPLVVTLALAISLIEAYWMLPAHVTALNIRFNRSSRIHQLRTRLIKQLRHNYMKILIRALRKPAVPLLACLLLFLTAVIAVVGSRLPAELPSTQAESDTPASSTLASLYTGGVSWLREHGVKLDFFASDPIRLFYVNLEMPTGTPLTETLSKLLALEDIVRPLIRDSELRDVAAYSGLLFTETAPFFGDHYGQLIVALKPALGDARNVDEIIASLREPVQTLTGIERIYFLRLSGGPPTTKPISVKVRGDDFDEIRAAAAELMGLMDENPYVTDINDDATPGQSELSLTVNQDAAHRAGIAPATIARSVQLMVDGEIVSDMQDAGEKLEVRVRAIPRPIQDISEVLAVNIPLPTGGSIPLENLLKVAYVQANGNIRHHNFRRTITVEADIDKTKTDTLTVNNEIRAEWQKLRARYPNVDLDFSGLLDDIQESLDAIIVLMLLGLGLIYLIVGTQFRSYFQPLLILATIPMAFTGVVIGLFVSSNPLSLFTLYGVVALTGIAVNSAIVLISAANQRLKSGMSVLHATVYAGRRRVIPVFITSLTTIAGLFSLATGLGGESLLWGPMANAIVWGLVVSTLLTLIVVPVLYRMFMPFSRIVRQRRTARASATQAA